jgi:hypothetical protein
MSSGQVMADHGILLRARGYRKSRVIPEQATMRNLTSLGDNFKARCGRRYWRPVR